MSKVAIICVYFGKLPSWFNLWLKSCQHNQKFNWLLITDDNEEYDYPENVKRVPFSFFDVKKLFNEKLKMDVNINDPYKICDFKPAFGALFDDYLEDYTHWGHCDLDMIFGDLGVFVNDDVLNKYDKVLKWGHLSIYKNNDIVNNYFKLTRPDLDYKSVFSNSVHYGFDESNGIEKILKYHGIEIYYKECIADIQANRQKFKLVNGKNYDKQIFYWKDGKIYQDYYENGMRSKREFAYIHFQKRKLPCNQIENNANQFLITPDGFYNTDVYNIEDNIYEKYNMGNIKKSLKMYVRYKRYAFTSAIQRRISYSDFYKKANR
ncbi:MAG: DUF6625 family protein [Bacillota bacterium]